MTLSAPPLSSTSCTRSARRAARHEGTVQLRGPSMREAVHKREAMGVRGAGNAGIAGRVLERRERALEALERGVRGAERVVTPASTSESLRQHPVDLEGVFPDLDRCAGATQ